MLPQAAARPLRTNATGRILLVDDDDAVRDALSIMLRSTGLDVVTAAEGNSARQLVAEDDSFDVLITDQSMAGMTGCELILKARECRPDLPMILITGFDKPKGLDRLGGKVKVFRKPFEGADLLDYLNRLLHAAAAPALSGSMG